jgi:hypothetical protein
MAKNKHSSNESVGKITVGKHKILKYTFGTVRSLKYSSAFSLFLVAMIIAV